MDKLAVLGRSLDDWCSTYPLICDLVALREVTWFNPATAPVAQAIGDVGLTAADVADASARLTRFSAYLRRAFPETEPSGGIIESDIRPLPHLQKLLGERYGQTLAGVLWLKRDSHLPISGSIKARGGIYEVLKHAEDLALAGGLLSLDDDYGLLDSDKARAFFGGYRIAVGSTGNLGLSIGI
ncbi:MAG: D-serine dehydratase, partial [Brevundimonas sp.]|nr:D-serine dehydratase [Brevundimonas sp.]